MTRLAAVLLAWAIASTAYASAWPTPSGETQVIVKAESLRSDAVYDAAGRLRPAERRIDRELSVFVEHGLTQRVTFQGKLSWQRGEDALLEYDGRGPMEAGLRYAVLDGRIKLAVYGGIVAAGQGRNAAYAPPGAGDGDTELRVLVGRDGVLPRRFGRRSAFVEVQVARLARSGLPDETRAEVTAGVHLTPRWTALYQTYAGATDDGGARWTNVEFSAVRRIGRSWSVQAGWRASTEGRLTPEASGPVLAVWRRL